MRIRALIWPAVAASLAPSIAFADVLVPLSQETGPTVLWIGFLEGVVIWLLLRKRASVVFWKLLLAAVVANLLTSFLGGYTPLKYLFPVTKWALGTCLVILLAFAASVAVEWLVYLGLFRRRPFRVDLTKRRLLAVTALANLASYAAILVQLVLLGHWWRQLPILNRF